MKRSLRRRFICSCIFLICLLVPAYSNADSNVQSGKDIIANKFMLDRAGGLYLIFKTDLYRSVSAKGDVWSKISSGIRQVVFDPGDVNVLYAITTNNLIQKSMDRGSSWLTIISGLPDAEYSAICIDPANNQNLFVGTHKGLYKSVNAGFSWSKTDLTGKLLKLEIKGDLQPAYFGLTIDGLYISQDLGARWHSISDALPKTIVKGSWRTAIRQPLKTYSIFTTQIGRPSVFILSAQGIYKSTDLGTQWNSASRGIDGGDIENGFTSVYSNQKNIYLGARGCIYKSDNNGENWKKISLSTMETEIDDIQGIYEHQGTGGLFLFDRQDKILFLDQAHHLIGLNYGVLPHSKILALANSRKNFESIVYAIVYNNNYTDVDQYGLFYSPDNGKTWHQSLLYKPYVDWTNWDALRNIFISPHNENEIWLYDKNSNFLTFSRGSKWEKLDVWPVNNNKVYNFDFDHSNEKISYICTENLFRFDLNTFKATNLKVKARDIIQAADDSNKLLAGFNLSLDGGWTWQDLYPNLKKYCSNSNRYSLNSLYFSGEKILLFVKGSCGAYCKYANLIASNDLGKTWRPLHTDKSTVFAYLNPYDPQNLYLGIGDSKKKAIMLLQSKDQGQTWQSYARYLPGNWDAAKKHNIRMMIVKGESESTTYLATMDGLYKSLNDGKSWELLGGIRSTETGKEKRSKIFSLVGSENDNDHRKTDRDSGRLTVETNPAGAKIRILNIKPKFEQGMLLAPGEYRLEVSFKGYKTKDFWIVIKPREKKAIRVTLSK